MSEASEATQFTSETGAAAAALKTSFRPEFVEQARAAAESGALDTEIAEELGVHVRALYRWRHAHPEFAAALRAGKDGPDDRVERTAYHRANGYDVVEQQAIKIKTQTAPGVFTESVVVVEVTRHVPADTTMNIFWLKNRRGWRDKVDVEANVGLTVTINGPDADL